MVAERGGVRLACCNCWCRCCSASAAPPAAHCCPLALHQLPWVQTWIPEWTTWVLLVAMAIYDVLAGAQAEWGLAPGLHGEFC